MNLLILADIDEFHWQWEKGNADVLISCGDVSDSLILEAAQAYSCRHVLTVKGNHDSNAPFPPPVIDLHLKTMKVNGVTFGGFNGAWKYKPRGHFLYAQDEARKALTDFPTVDVFVAHDSPRKIHDVDDEIHHGFEAFSEYIARAKPKLFFHGHQHVRMETTVNETRIIGVFGHRVLEIASKE